VEEEVNKSQDDITWPSNGNKTEKGIEFMAMDTEIHDREGKRSQNDKESRQLRCPFREGKMAGLKKRKATCRHPKETSGGIKSQKYQHQRSISKQIISDWGRVLHANN
jgi:hypothetical protein